MFCWMEKFTTVCKNDEHAMVEESGGGGEQERNAGKKYHWRWKKKCLGVKCWGDLKAVVMCTSQSVCITSIAADQDIHITQVYKLRWRGGGDKEKNQCTPQVTREKSKQDWMNTVNTTAQTLCQNSIIWYGKFQESWYTSKYWRQTWWRINNLVMMQSWQWI